MHPGMVLECFFLYSLLLQSSHDGELLELPHQGEQQTRLLNALNARNKRAAGTGLLHWSHTCDWCHPVVKNPLTGEERM